MSRSSRRGSRSTIQLCCWNGRKATTGPRRCRAGSPCSAALLGFLAAWQLHDWRLVVGALLILANWPYTLLAIKPTNDRLHATKPEQANAETRQAIISWGHLHGGRSAFGVAATLMFLWALTA